MMGVNATTTHMSDSFSPGDYFAELEDYENLLKTSPHELESEKSTLIASLDRQGIKKGLWLFRVFG